MSTEISDEPVNLTISYVNDPPIGPLVEGFTDLHPNVTVDLVETPFADYQTSVRLALASDDPPDIVQYSPGPMRSIVPAGLVEPLDEYAEAYDWRDAVPESILGILHSSKEATQYGTGSLYAMPGAIQMVGVFYNRELAAEAGVTDEPTTLEEFEQDLADVKSSGVTPLTVTALGVGGFQLWSALANVMADVDTLNAWVFGEPGTSLENDGGFVEAAAKMHEWGEAGYFADDVAAVGDADGVAELTSGERAYFVTGNWDAQTFVEALGEDVGFFLLPGITADQPPVAMGSAFPYSISSNSPNQDVAAAFFDYMVSESAAEGVYESGFVPVTHDASDETSGLSGEILESYEKVVDGAGVAPFINWATSSMLDTLTSGVQSLISGSLSPEEFVASLQEDWESNQQ